MTEAAESQDANPLATVDGLADQIKKIRNRPLLVMYYPGSEGSIRDSDVRDVYNEFRTRGCSKSGQEGRALDVLLHTYGGDPIASYRLAQVIRDFSNNVVFLVPEHAYSGGTLLCLSGNTIRLGACAALSPIDITLGVGTEQEDQAIQLLNVDYYLKFVTDCRHTIEEMLEKKHENGKTTNVECELLGKMVEQVGALNVGYFYRERTITGHYANRLLIDYMLVNKLNKKDLASRIIQTLLFEMPSHNFSMDFHICQEMSLPVEEMADDESDMTKQLVYELTNAAQDGIICREVANNYKLPYFRLYSV